MRYVMLTYTHPDRVREWEEMTPEEQQAYVAEHETWFAEHGDVLAGGEELAYPGRAATIVGGRGEKLITDGPYTETKDHLGGMIVLEVESFDRAVEVASSWPSLLREGNRVEILEGANRQP